MRGGFRDQGGLFSYLSPEARVAADHPLREVRRLVRDVLTQLSSSLGRLYASEGRPSVPPEQLLSALLLQVFFSIRSERQLIEQLNYNLLYRWFVGLSPDDPVWDATTFTKNRERLQRGEVFQKFMSQLLHHPQVAPLLSSEHFSIDGTLIEAWASQKSFRPKDGNDGDGTDFRGQRRKNDTHASVTDPQSRLYRKAAGREAKLCYMGHVTMENRHGLAVAGMVTQADGASHHGGRGQGLRYQRTRGQSARHPRNAARGAERQRDQDRQATPQRRRWSHDAARRLPDVAIAPRHDRVHLRLGQAARHAAQDQASRPLPRRRRLPAQSDRL